MTEEITRLDYEMTKDKFGEWAPLFKPFIESEKMFNIVKTIRDDSKIDRIVPKSSDTFRAFSTISPTNLKVVFYLMDPYPRKYANGEYQATGIAMDCSNSPNGKLQPSLDLFYNSISTDLGKKVEKSPSLIYLHEQGVMMLNTDLTCKLYRTESHAQLWEPFQKYFLEEVLGSSTNVIFVLCGKSSNRMEKYINPFCKIFKLDHPAFAARNHVEWDHDHIFNKINRILKDNNDKEIFWDKKDWIEYCSPPF